MINILYIQTYNTNIHTPQHTVYMLNDLSIFNFFVIGGNLLFDPLSLSPSPPPNGLVFD